MLRRYQNIAESSGTLVIAEGIETQTDLLLIRDLGVACGPGYHIARPNSHPITELPIAVAASLRTHGVPVYPRQIGSSSRNVTASRIVRVVPPIPPATQNDDVYDIFVHSPKLQVLPVVDRGKPVGLLTRSGVIDGFARPFVRESATALENEVAQWRAVGLDFRVRRTVS